MSQTSWKKHSILQWGKDINSKIARQFLGTEGSSTSLEDGRWVEEEDRPRNDHWETRRGQIIDIHAKKCEFFN